MALQTETPTTTPAPQVVGNAFVSQYYRVLLSSPELIHRFYQDSSILSRPEGEGVVTPAIDEKLLSYNFVTSEIESIDSQASYQEGVIIVVIGHLIGNDNVRRKFTQSFFLAPQDIGGFFVRNNIFRFLDEPSESDQILANGINEDAPTSPPSLASEESNIVEVNHVGELASPPSERDSSSREEVVTPSENGSSGVEDEAAAVDPAVQEQSHEVLVKQSHEVPVKQSLEMPVQEVANSVSQEDGHKKSYASIVKVARVSSPQKSAYVPTTKAMVHAKIPAKDVVSTEKPVNVPTTSAPTQDTKKPNDNTAPEITNPLDVEGHSIYIRNLPLNATAELVEEELKKFGTIKPGGVQVRNHKVDRFCFGFVEFESENAMRDAIKASPINMGGRQVFIQEKRTTTRVVNGVVISNGNGWGRFPVGRGAFRSDNFRGGRGSFAGNNQGYRRPDFRNHGEFAGPGRGRGPLGYFGDGYQHRAVHNGNNGNGRTVRPIAANRTAIPA